MDNSMLKIARGRGLARWMACSLMLALCAATDASAVALYWTKTPVKSGSVKTCLGFASDAMRAVGMQGIRASNMEVAGSRGNAYVAITCVNTTPRATAVVMAAGDDLAETRRLSEALQHKIASIILFDSSP